LRPALLRVEHTVRLVSRSLVPPTRPETNNARAYGEPIFAKPRRQRAKFTPGSLGFALGIRGREGKHPGRVSTEGENSPDLQITSHFGKPAVRSPSGVRMTSSLVNSLWLVVAYQNPQTGNPCLRCGLVKVECWAHCFAARPCTTDSNHWLCVSFQRSSALLVTQLRAVPAAVFASSIKSQAAGSGSLRHTAQPGGPGSSA